MSKMGTMFHRMSLPMGGERFIPNDIEIQFPVRSVVQPHRAHLLAYIPWSEKYLRRVPQSYQGFFMDILPHLEARTTNVHTATSAAMLTELTGRYGAPIDEYVAYAALLLHDSGWSRVSQAEIADSLDYRGLAHSGVEEEVAKGPKSKHDVLGEAIAREVLAGRTAGLRLTRAQKDYICLIVRNHTEAQYYRVDGVVPLELRLVHDADRLWSYSHENFWQDTIRKHVGPQTYAYNLAVAIDGYFLTDEARAMARDLLLDREAEVAELYMMLERRQPAQLRSLIHG